MECTFQSVLHIVANVVCSLRTSYIFTSSKLWLVQRL